MSCPLRLVCVGHLAEFVLILVTEHSEPPLMKESGRRVSWKEGRGEDGEGGREGGREWVNLGLPGLKPACHILLGLIFNIAIFVLFEIVRGSTKQKRRAGLQQIISAYSK